MFCQDATPHIPVGRHPDGAWVFAPLGALAITDGGRGLVCHGCGEVLQVLSAEHLRRRHGLTLSAYRSRFGLAASMPLLAPALRSARELEARRRHEPGGALAAFPAQRSASNAQRARVVRLRRAVELGFPDAEAYLVDAYGRRLLSVQEIAVEWRCSTRTVRAELAIAGVELRPARKRRPR